MRTLEVFGLAPEAFFGQALDVVTSPERFLAELEREGEPEPPLRRMIEATSQLEREPRQGGPAEKPLAPGRAEAWVRLVARRSRSEQRRTLRATRKYRHCGFARLYLEHLDVLRYQQPRDAARLAATVATDLVPQLTGSGAEKIVLQCQAFGVYGSARRILGAFPEAARAQRLALDLARRHQLSGPTAELLQRGSYVLSDCGLFNRALLLLREALEIHFDAAASLGIAKTLVDRGIMFHYAGSDGAAVRALRRALDFFPAQGVGLRRNLQALYHHLTLALISIGDLAAAEQCLEDAEGVFDYDDGVSRARLVWHRGRILLARGDYREAERRFRAASQGFDRLNDPESALIALDLIKALLARGQNREAQQVARETVALLMRYRGTRITRATMNEFIRAGTQGRVTRELIDRIDVSLQKRRQPAPGRPVSAPLAPREKVRL